jgi:hypothetical protein
MRCFRIVEAPGPYVYLRGYKVDEEEGYRTIRRVPLGDLAP